MIKLINVNKYYQSGSEKIHVIKDLNYEFPNTGLVFVLGPSGSGKSTLLNLLGGLDKPDSGEIWIENRKMSSFSKKEYNYYLNSYLGFVFQEYNILKDLTLKENIKLSLQLQKVKKKEANEKVNAIINEVELTGLEKRKVSQLSGGQKQRIAIARALVKDPSLIIADEPTGNLDSETSAKIFELFKRLSKNRLIIIVSHDEESANLYGDQILRIDTATTDDKESKESKEFKNSLDSSDSLDSLSSDRKLYLEKAQTPLSTILKLAFKNLTKKWLRYFLMFMITTISLVFLSFAIELNGDKLYQNVYTTINNDVNYADIYQYYPSEEPTDDAYAKYAKGKLMTNAYEIIKGITNDLTIHKYQNVNLNYTYYNNEKANFLYRGAINNLIYYDPTNSYNLLSGTLPDPNEPEILITDYLLDALKYFGIVATNTDLYSILNTYLNIDNKLELKIVGVIETNYRKWIHLSWYEFNHKISSADDLQGFEYDYTMMNAIIVGETYYNYIINNVSFDTEISVNYELFKGYQVNAYQNQTILFGSVPQSANQITLPYQLVIDFYDLGYSSESYISSFINEQVLTSTLTISQKYKDITRNNANFSLYINNDCFISGITGGNEILFYQSTYDGFVETLDEANLVNTLNEKVLVELPNDPQVALSYFNQLYNNDYHFIIDIFAYQNEIESYNVDPMVEFISNMGLIIFTVLSIGIMWTIISIEIVDSRKEIGIMRSIGLSGFKISLIFIIQAVFVNVLAYGVAIGLAGKLISLFGSNITDPLGQINLSLYTLTYRSPLILFVFIIVITLISSFIPLIKIMSQKIINVINERNK